LRGIGSPFALLRRNLWTARSFNKHIFCQKNFFPVLFFLYPKKKEKKRKKREKKKEVFMEQSGRGFHKKKNSVSSSSNLTAPHMSTTAVGGSGNPFGALLNNYGGSPALLGHVNNPLTKFFGPVFTESSQNLTQAMYNAANATTSPIFPQSQNGVNEFMADTISDGVTRYDTWQTSVMLPWRDSKVISIVWKMMHFAHTIAHETPHEGYSRMIRSFAWTDRAKMVRRGLMFKIEQDFYDEPDGEIHYQNQIVAINQSCALTAALDVETALYTCKNARVVEGTIRGGRPKVTWESLFQTDKRMWGIAHDPRRGLTEALSLAKVEMSKNSGNPVADAFIAPERTLSLLTNTTSGSVARITISEQTGTGAIQYRVGPEPYAYILNGRVAVYATQEVDADISSSIPYDTLRSLSVLGEFYHSRARYTGESVRADYKTTDRDILVFDMIANGFVPLSFYHGVMNSMRWNLETGAILGEYHRQILDHANNTPAAGRVPENLTVFDKNVIEFRRDQNPRDSRSLLDLFICENPNGSLFTNNKYKLVERIGEMDRIHALKTRSLIKFSETVERNMSAKFSGPDLTSIVGEFGRFLSLANAANSVYGGAAGSLAGLRGFAGGDAADRERAFAAADSISVIISALLPRFGTAARALAAANNSTAEDAIYTMLFSPPTAAAAAGAGLEARLAEIYNAIPRESTGNWLARGIALLYAFSPNVRSTWDAWLQYDVPVPANVRYVRSLITHEMYSFIFAKAGNATGATFFGKANWTHMHDGGAKVFNGHLTMYLKAVVTNPNNVTHIGEGFILGYVGGQGTGMMRNQADWEITRVLDPSASRKHDVMCILEPFEYLDANTTLDKVQDLTGRLAVSTAVIDPFGGSLVGRDSMFLFSFSFKKKVLFLIFYFFLGILHRYTQAHSSICAIDLRSRTCNDMKIAETKLHLTHYARKDTLTPFIPTQKNGFTAKV
jgi:hypothetical protein